MGLYSPIRDGSVRWMVGCDSLTILNADIGRFFNRERKGSLAGANPAFKFMFFSVPQRAVGIPRGVLSVS